MNASFILTLDTGSDTDLIGIAQDIQDLVDGEEGLHVIDCKPYQHPTLGIGGPAIPGALPPPNPLGGT